jgi:hypothetical protein
MNKSLNISSENQVSMSDLGLFWGSLDWGQEVGGAGPYLVHWGSGHLMPGAAEIKRKMQGLEHLI